MDVVAKIKEALFFNPGLGVVSTSEEVYVLKEPIATNIDGKEALMILFSQNLLFQILLQPCLYHVMQIFASVFPAHTDCFLFSLPGRDPGLPVPSHYPLRRSG